MIEREMGYRGSKSVIIDSYSTVKEQRADGRRWIKTKIRRYRFNHLRCALWLYESINITLALSTKLIYNINLIFSKSNISLSSTYIADKPKVVLQSSVFFMISPSLIAAFINKCGFAALLKWSIIIILLLFKILYYYIGIIIPLIFIILYPFIYSRFINLFVYCFIKKLSDKNRIKAKFLKFATYNWLFVASLIYIFIHCICYIILVKSESIFILAVIVCILMLFIIYKRKSIKIKLFRLYICYNNKKYFKLFLCVCTEKILLIVGLKFMILLNLGFFGSLVNYFDDNCIIVFIHTVLCTNLLVSIYALYIENIPMGLYFNIFKSMTNSSYLFFSKDRFGFLSKNNRFLVIKLLLSSDGYSAPVPRAALLSEENVIELLNKKFQLTRDFIKNNISLSKENIEALDQILDLTIDSNITKKYALVFGKITRAIQEKALKYTLCPNEVHLFEKKGIFHIKDNAIRYIITHERGKDSIYVYGDRYLFKLHEKKSILTQNQILYVKYYDEYLPYDPGVRFFGNRTLYIKTLNSEFKELDMKTPHSELGAFLHSGQTSEVMFFIIKDNKLWERGWKPESKDFFLSPINNSNGGIVRRDVVRNNKFLLNNKNN